MNFHLASRGEPLTLASQQEGGVVFKLSNKTIKKSSLAQLFS